MTTPNTPDAISMVDINSELDLLTPAINIDLKADLYNTANAGGGVGLMYHNLNMATNNTTTAKVAIYDPLTANADMTMSNWYNYTRNTGMVMTYLITNSSPYNVNFDLVIWDQNDTSQGTIFSGLITTGSNTGTQTVNTGLLTITGGGGISSGYRIAIQDVTFSPGPNPVPPAPPVIPSNTFAVTITVDSASDTDGVGAGTTRTTYGPFSYSETQNQPPAPSPPTPFTPSKAVDTSGSLIFVNKRTTVSITIS
jgi:hypothetical protein